MTNAAATVAREVGKVQGAMGAAAKDRLFTERETVLLNDDTTWATQTLQKFEVLNFVVQPVLKNK